MGELVRRNGPIRRSGGDEPTSDWPSGRPRRVLGTDLGRLPSTFTGKIEDPHISGSQPPSEELEAPSPAPGPAAVDWQIPENPSRTREEQRAAQLKIYFAFVNRDYRRRR